MSSKIQGDQKNFLKVPKGTRDREPIQMKVLENVFGVITNCFKRHDAVTIETPVFELKDVLTGKYGEDSKLIYNLEDQGGELLALRYDLTVPFARYVAMRKIKTIKRYQIGKVYRRDQPAIARGRYREFYQCDFDIAGEFGSMIADAECLRIIYEVLNELELGKFIIKVNHRRLLDGLFTACGVPSNKFTATCSAIDKLDKVPWEVVERELCEEKGIAKETVNKIGHYFQLSSDMDLLTKLESDAMLIDQSSAKVALEELRRLFSYCSALGISDRVKFDLSLARGLDYYTGVIYEAVHEEFMYNPSAVSVTNDSQAQKDKKTNKNSSADESLAVGSLAGGGRYDNLVGMFDPSGGRVPCVGMSFGVERLLTIKEALLVKNNKNHNVRPTETDVYVVGAHKNLLIQRLQCCRLLWDAKIKATMSHKLNPKILDQFQYCEENKIPYAVVLGESELSRGVVLLKHVDTRQQHEVKYDDLINELNRLLYSFQPDITGLKIN